MASKSSRHNLTTAKLRWLNLVLILFIFLLPTNLFLSLFKGQAYVSGIFSDYLIVKMYLSEIILWLYFSSLALIARPALQTWLKQKKIASAPKKSTLLLLLLVGAAIIVRQLFSEYPLVGLWTVFQWIEIVLLAICMSFHFSLDQKRFAHLLIVGFASAILFQSIIGLSQYVLQRSVLGFTFLGEPNLTNTFNIDRFTNSAGISRILPYGTTAHPNVLGGYLAVYSVLLLGLFDRIKKQTKKVFLLSTICTAFGIVFITHSLAALLTIVVGVVVVLSLRCQWFTKLFRPEGNHHLLLAGMLSITTFLAPLAIFLLPVILPTSISVFRRNWLQQAALQMTLHFPLLGAGLSQFVTKLTLFTENTDVWRFLQPAHSVPWLFLSEVGLIGVVLLYLVWRVLPPIIKTTLLLTITVLLAPICLDHYLFSIQPGRWIWPITLVAVYAIIHYRKPLGR